MTSSFHELARPRWRGAEQRGLYEVWFVTAHDPESGWSFWVRYTLHSVAPPSPSEAGLWAFAFPPDGPPLALHDVYPLARLELAPGPGALRLRLGPGHLRSDGAEGEVGAGERRVRWDLRFDVTQPGFAHVPPLLQRIRLASAAVTTPYLHARISGQVEVAGRRFDLREVPGELGHTWGRRHADAWAWAHAHGFAGAPEVAFDGVSARVRRFGVGLPTATAFALSDGSVRWTGPAALFRPACAFELGRWTFRVRTGRRLVRGEVTAPPERFLAVEYSDPTGERRWCHHAEHADMTLEVLRLETGAWQRERLLEATRSVAFEITGSEPDPRVPHRLPLAAARHVG